MSDEPVARAQTGYVHISRPRVVNRLLGAPERVIVLTAPPGYGKTSALNEMVASLPGSGTHASWVDWPTLLRLGPAAFGVGDRPRLLIVEHNANHAPEEAVKWRTLDVVAARLPRATTVVIATRSRVRPPPGKVTSSAIAQVCADDLAFTQEESTAFLRANLEAASVSAAQATQLHDLVEGWPAGLAAAVAIARRHPGEQDWDLLGRGLSGELKSYFAEQVLRLLPRALRAFIAESALLRELSPDLCDFALERTDGLAMIGAVTDENLFVSPIGQGKSLIHRYHPLFAQALSENLIDSEPERVRRIHRRASAWHERRGPWQTTLLHLLGSGDLQRAADLLTLHHRPGAATAPTPTPQTPAHALSVREMEVLRLLAQGLKNQQIASQLFISLATVKAHVYRLCRKLGAANRTSAVARGRWLRLIT